MAEDFKLGLLYENTFKENYPDLNQAELEAKYLEEFKTFKKSKKLSHTLAWQAFQKERGTLLAPDPKGKWGDGRSLFRASIKSDGKLSVDIAPQVRAWRTKFLTEGSPGTKLALKDTGKQFYDSETGHTLQIHHEKGISEYGPFIDESIKKLIPGSPTKVLREGLQEYKTFKKWAFDSGRVFGDKVENYTALLKNQHINIPGSVHWLRSKEGPFYSVKLSGGSAFDDKGKAVKKLKAQTGVSVTPTQDLLNKAYRKGYTKNYDITKPGTIWDEMGTWHDLTEQSTKDATALTRQLANPIDGPKKPPKIDEARIKSTDIKNQIPVIKKIAAEYEANEGLSKIDAINKAKIEYNRIRYGDTLARGIDIRKLGLLSGGVVTALKGLPGQAATFAKGFLGPEDLFDENVTVNFAQFQNRVDAGDNVFTAAKEEGMDALVGFKDQLLTTGGLLTGMKGISMLGTKGAAVATGAGGVFGAVAPPLLTYAVYEGVNSYLKERTGRSLNERVIMDTGYASLLKTDRVVNQEVDDDGVSREVVTYEKDPEVEEEKWDKMRTYFENRNK